jgi:hypothetical protein
MSAPEPGIAFAGASNSLEETAAHFDGTGSTQPVDEVGGDRSNLFGPRIAQPSIACNQGFGTCWSLAV